MKLWRQKLKDIIQKIFEKIGCHSNDVGPRSLQWISRNEAVTHLNQQEFWNQKAKQIFSWQSKNLILRLIFSVPDPLLYNHWKRPGTDSLWLTSKILPLPMAHLLGLAMYKVLLDSDKYLLNYSALINLLEPDVHHMMSQILSILIDFYPDLCTIFSIIFPIFRPL